MVNKIRGLSDIGEFLTGNIDFFTITTIVPCLNTMVVKELDILKAELGIGDSDISTIDGFIINGVSYANDNDYISAFNKQSNLDSLIQIIDNRAQTIMLNVTSKVVTDVSTEIPGGAHESEFGTKYAGLPGIVYQIKFALEHESVWQQDDLTIEIDKSPALDISTNAFITNNDNGGIIERNTIVIRNQFL